jgi:hypothetical protein
LKIERVKLMTPSCRRMPSTAVMQAAPSRTASPGVPGLSHRKPGRQRRHPHLGIVWFQRIALKCDDIHPGFIRKAACDRLNIPARHHDPDRTGIARRKRPCKGNQLLRDRQDPAIRQFGNDNNFLIHESSQVPLKNGFVKSSAGKARKA